MTAVPPQLELGALTERVAAFVPRRAPALGRPAAVLVPILPRQDGLHLLFTERSASLRAHAGQISFPGGKVDPGDAGMRETALREANEEIGLDASHARIIGQLDDVPTFVTSFVITPIVSILDARWFSGEERYPWRLSAHEVVRLHELPLEEFLEPQALRIEERERDGVRFELYWYTVRGTIVWGATARIVHQLLDVALDLPIELPPWERGQPGSAS